MRRSSARGFILLIVLAVLGVLAILSLNLAQMGQQSRALSRTHLDKVHARLGVRSAMEHVIRRLFSTPFPVDNSWKYFGEDANANGVLDPGEDADGDGKLARFSCPLERARRGSYPVMEGGVPARLTLDSLDMGLSGSLDSLYGPGSLAFSFMVDRMGERLDLISEQSISPYIDCALRPHIDSNFGMECTAGPLHGSGLKIRKIWEGELNDATQAGWPFDGRLPFLVEPVQERVLRRFSSCYVDMLGPLANNNSIVEPAEWRGFDVLQSAPGNLFFHPQSETLHHCLGRRQGGGGDLGWLSHRVNAWIEGLKGRPASWADFVASHTLYESYLHDAALDPVGKLSGGDVMSEAVRREWARSLEELFSINRTQGLPCTWIVPEGPVTGRVMTTSSTPATLVGFDTAKPFGVMRPGPEIGGRWVRLPYLNIQEAPLVLLTANLLGVQGVFDPYFIASYEVDRNVNTMVPLVHNSLRSGAITPVEQYWSHMTRIPGLSGSLPVDPNANDNFGQANNARYGQGVVEISLGEARAMADAVVAQRPIQSWRHLKKVFVDALCAHLKLKYAEVAARGKNRYQRAEVISELAVAAWNPEYLGSRNIADGLYPMVSMDRSMISRGCFPAVLESPETFAVECLSVLHQGGAVRGTSRAAFTLETQRWFSHETQRDFTQVPPGWETFNAGILTHPACLDAGAGASTLDGSITVRPVDETLNDLFGEAAFAAMFSGSLNGSKLVGGVGVPCIPTPGGYLHPDGMSAYPKDGMPPCAYPIWTGDSAEFFPYGSTWCLEFWVKTGFRPEILRNLSNSTPNVEFVAFEPNIDRDTPGGGLGLNYKIGVTLVGWHQAQMANRRYLKLSPPNRLAKSKMTGTPPFTLYGHEYPATTHAFGQSIGGNLGKFTSGTTGLGIFPLFGGRDESIGAGNKRYYSFANDLRYAFGGGKQGLDPGEWHHVVIRHVPHDFSASWGPITTGTARHEVVVDGADTLRWTSAYAPPDDVARNMTITITDVKPDWPSGPFQSTQWDDRIMYPNEIGQTWRHFVIPAGEDTLEYWQGRPAVDNVKPVNPAGLPYDPAIWAERATPPSVQGQTWRHFSNGGYTQVSDWDDPTVYAPGWYPGPGRTVDEYVWAYVVGGNRWTDDMYFPFHPETSSGVGGEPRAGIPSKESLFPPGAWPGYGVTDVRAYIWGYYTMDMDRYFPWHDFNATPPRGGPPGPTFVVGDEEVQFNRTYFRPEPAAADLAASPLVSLVFHQLSGLDANKMIDNVVLWPAGRGWAGGAVNPLEFPQRYAPRGGRTQAERPVYRNAFVLPKEFQRSQVKKIRWEATHPTRYSGLDLGSVADSLGQRRCSVDVRVFLTDGTGAVLDDPGVEQGWDGSGRNVDIPVTDGRVPYMAVFYNGRLPDWGTPVKEGLIPVCSEVPPAVPEALQVENISPRLHSVSVLVRAGVISQFRME